MSPCLCTHPTLDLCVLVTALHVFVPVVAFDEGFVAHVALRSNEIFGLWLIFFPIFADYYKN